MISTKATLASKSISMMHNGPSTNTKLQENSIMEVVEEEKKNNACLERPRLVRNMPQPMLFQEMPKTFTVPLRTQLKPPIEIMEPLYKNDGSPCASTDGIKLTEKNSQEGSWLGCRGSRFLDTSLSSSSSLHDLDHTTSLASPPPFAPRAVHRRPQVIEVTIPGDNEDERERRLTGYFHIDNDDEASLVSVISCEDWDESAFFELENSRDHVCCEDEHDQICLGTFVALTCGFPVPFESVISS